MADYVQQTVQWYNGTASAISGSTAFGYFDSDTYLQSEAPKIQTFIARQLGWPVHDIEITNEQIYDAVEWALMKYSTIQNEFRVEESYFDMYGQPTSSVLTNRLAFPSLQHIIRMSEPFNLEAGVPNYVPIHTGSIIIQPNRQNYDLLSEFFAINHPSEYEFTVRKIFHNRIPASRTYATSMFNMPMAQQMNASVSDNAWFTLMPFGYDVSRAQAVSMNRELRLSHFGYELQGTNLRLFPAPINEFTLYFHYTLGSEEISGRSGSVFQRDDIITDPSDIQLDYIQYSDLNSKDRNWVKEYALEIARKQLGMNRRKYSNIDYEGGSVSLDGDALVSEAVTRMENMEQMLKEHLSKLSHSEGMNIKADSIQRQLEILRHVPLGLYKI